MEPREASEWWARLVLDRPLCELSESIKLTAEWSRGDPEFVDNAGGPVVLRAIREVVIEIRPRDGAKFGELSKALDDIFFHSTRDEDDTLPEPTLDSTGMVIVR